jgi:DNA polymerase
MTRTPDARRDLIEAMGLGPVWVRRNTPAPRDEDPGDERVVRIARLDWEPLREAVAVCTACALSRTRTQTVFGVGVPRPDWLIVGEAPGADEDASGEPFVGQAGKLLDAMLAAVGLSRERNVFIANVLKCRPPGNRDPSTSEVASCRGYLERQIELLAPRMILVVGKVASAALLGGDLPMSRLRGRRHEITIAGRTIPVVATYHPAYLLRSGEEKAKAWADLCFARDVFAGITATG